MSLNESIVLLSTGWKFGRFAPGCEAPDYDESRLATVTVPHQVVDLPWRDWDPDSWESRWIYRKHFAAPPGWQEMRTFVDFGAAMTHAVPVLNGTGLEDHLGGYLPFSREVTGVLRSEDNLLVVTLGSSFNLNVPPNRPAPYEATSVDYWQPGGLYRPVTLRTVPAIFVADLFAKPVDVLDPAGRRIELECTVDAATAATAEVEIVLADAAGTTVGSTRIRIQIDRPGMITGTGVLDGLADVALWDVEEPNLYTVTATLMIDGSPQHSRSTRTGFRDARFEMDGFYLNGRRLQIFGANRHQLYPYAGAAMPDRVQRKDAEILRRKLNCNMVRCSHYPQADAFFDACDELGLMAWEEAPGWGYLGDDEWKELAHRDVGEMVRKDRNHPSIIIWGARLNETDDDLELYTRTRDRAHELDGSRPTAGAMAGRLDSQEYVHEVFSEDDYNSTLGVDGRKWPRLEPPRADRPYLISESVGTLSGPERFYRRFGSQREQQGQALAHAQVHNIAAADPHFCGVIAWSGIDYESGTGPNIDHGVKYTGVVDLFRIPKPGAAFYRAQCDPRIEPVIEPAFYWDFGRSPVDDLDTAMICSNLDRLEVFIADDHFATVMPDRDNYPHVGHAPSFVRFSGIDRAARPELRIDGYLDDELVLSRSFSSDPSTDLLSVRADDDELLADGVDSTRIELRALDRYGAPRPYVEGDVVLEIDGPADLIGDNPFPFGAAGAAGAVWIRTIADRDGALRIRATHPTLGAAEVTVNIMAREAGSDPVPETNPSRSSGVPRAD